MRLIATILTMTLLLASWASAQPPDQFVLYQNDPDPFCLQESPSGTVIRFELPQAVHVQLEVWSPDASSVVRSLVDGFLPTGFHEVIWDGLDAVGEIVEDGAYPYAMTAADSVGGIVLFEQTLVATVDCSTPVDEIGWGCIKARYGRTGCPTSD